MSWSVPPSSARSAAISPTTLANLKPWPLQGETTTTCGAPGSVSMMKCSSGVLVNMHVLSVSAGPSASGR